MPPSGYSTTQAHAIEGFLRSCAQALEAEAREKKIDLPLAIAQELDSIGRHLAGMPTSNCQAAVLRLTEAFYRKLHQKNSKDPSSYWKQVDNVCKEMAADILAIKVVPSEMQST
jgi:hypothetical protein